MVALAEIPRAVLETWPGRWRHPELLVQLADTPGDLPADEVARCILKGLSEPLSLELAVERLVDAGEFEIAARLVADKENAGELGAGTATARQRIEAARRAAREELSARLLAGACQVE